MLSYSYNELTLKPYQDICETHKKADHKLIFFTIKSRKLTTDHS